MVRAQGVLPAQAEARVALLRRQHGGVHPRACERALSLSHGAKPAGGPSGPAHLRVPPPLPCCAQASLPSIP